MDEKNKEITLEAAFEQLDEIVERLDAGELSLEESFDVYKTGMELLKNCNDKIDNVEKKMMQINGSGELSEF